MGETDNKSIEIVRKLEKCVSQGILKPEMFPQSDVLNMVLMEYSRWMQERTYQIRECVNIYNRLIGMAIEKRDTSRLSELLKELIRDMEKTPVEAADRLDDLRRILVAGYIQYAQEIHRQYQYQSTLKKRAFQGRGAVYTVITGEYDILKDPVYVNPMFDYICFTDNRKLRSKSWNIRFIEMPGGQKTDNVRLARKHKILCHKFLKEYDYSIYVDGKMQIIGDFDEYINRYSMGNPMLCFPHFARNCVYDEASACVASLKDDEKIIDEQIKGYRQEGYPARNGLIDSACLVRQHNDKRLQQVMECWWSEVREKSRRDQLSIGYVCWKNDFHYDICDLFIYDNEFICKRRDGEAPY